MEASLPESIASTYLDRILLLYFILKLLMMPMSQGCSSLVVFGGRNTSLIAFKVRTKGPDDSASKKYHLTF